MSSRRPRGTAAKAEADIRAAMGRMASGRAQSTNGKLTTVNLAVEAGMSRKQLYHYLLDLPALANAWRELMGDHRTSAPKSDDEVLRGRIAALERELATWQALAAIARADAERQAATNAALRAHIDRLEAAARNAGRILMPIDSYRRGPPAAPPTEIVTHGRRTDTVDYPLE